MLFRSKENGSWREKEGGDKRVEKGEKYCSLPGEVMVKELPDPQHREVCFSSEKNSLKRKLSARVEDVAR